MFFYKNNVYKHIEPDFWQKSKHKLRITSALNLPYQLKNRFKFNEIDCYLMLIR